MFAFAAGDIDFSLSSGYAQLLSALGAGKHLMRFGSFHAFEEVAEPAAYPLEKRHEFIILRTPFHHVFGKHTVKGVSHQKQGYYKPIRRKVDDGCEYQRR